MNTNLKGKTDYEIVHALKELFYSNYNKKVIFRFKANEFTIKTLLKLKDDDGKYYLQIFNPTGSDEQLTLLGSELIKCPEMEDYVVYLEVKQIKVDIDFLKKLSKHIYELEKDMHREFGGGDEFILSEVYKSLLKLIEV